MNTEDRKKRITRNATIALAVVGGFLIAPFIFVAIGGMVGAIVAGVIGLAAVNFAPIVAQKFANWRLKAMKGEAWDNPVETFETEYTSRVHRLELFAKELTAFNAELDNFENDFEQFKPSATAGELARYQRQVDASKKLKAYREAKFVQARLELEKFYGEIQKAKASYKMALSSMRMNKVSNMDFDPMAQIRMDTAIESIQTAVSTSFAELETELLKEMKPALIEHMPMDVIDVTPRLVVKERAA